MMRALLVFTVLLLVSRLPINQIWVGNRNYRDKSIALPVFLGEQNKLSKPSNRVALEAIFEYTPPESPNTCLVV